MVTDQKNDQELLRRSGRDPDAFRTLYDRHAGSLLAYLRRGCDQADVAVELLAETMALAYEHRERHDPDRGPVRAWLFGIARHQLQAYWRTRRVETAAIRRLAVLVPELDEDSAERIDAMVDAERARPELAGALDQLSDAEREAVLLRVVDGLDYEDVADRLDVTRATARVRVHRGLVRLKSRLEATR